MKMIEKHWIVEHSSYWLRQVVYLVSEGVSEILPLVTPLPLVAIIVWEMASWVLPFGPRANWVVAIIGGLTMEFLGMVAVLLYEQVKQYNAIRPKDMRPISATIPITAMVYYIIAAVIMITAGTVLPAAGFASKTVAPYMLYPFILLVFFGYLFIGVRSSLASGFEEIDTRKKAASDQEQKQREQESRARQQQQEEEERQIRIQERQAEIERQRAEADRIRAEAEATKTKAEASKIRAQKAVQPAPAPAPAPAPVTNGHDWRKATWSSIDEWLAMGLRPDELKPVEIERLTRLYEIFQDTYFSTAQALEILDLGSVNSVLPVLKLAYARKMLETNGGSQYRILTLVKIP